MKDTIIRRFYREHSILGVILLTSIPVGFYWILMGYSKQLEAQVSPEIVQTIKFAAFLLSAYPFLQSLGKASYRDEMIKKTANPNSTDKDRNDANDQLRKLDHADQTEKVIGSIGLILLAVLAFFGHI